MVGPGRSQSAEILRKSGQSPLIEKERESAPFSCAADSFKSGRDLRDRARGQEHPDFRVDLGVREWGKAPDPQACGGGTRGRNLGRACHSDAPVPQNGSRRSLRVIKPSKQKRAPKDPQELLREI